MNLKDLITLNVFPTDEAGFFIVPMRGLTNFPSNYLDHHRMEPPVPENPVARIFPLLLPGPFCLVGIDSAGDLSSWNADGEVNPLLPFGIVMSADEREINSLEMPASIETCEYTVANSDDEPIGSFDDEGMALGYADFDAGDQVFRTTVRTFALPPGFATGIEIEQITPEEFVTESYVFNGSSPR